MKIYFEIIIINYKSKFESINLKIDQWVRSLLLFCSLINFLLFVCSVLTIKIFMVFVDEKKDDIIFDIEY